ncbi:MAG: biotin/lipoyl-containing protein, partial [Myxococcota bacterium]
MTLKSPPPNVRADMAFEFKLPDIGEGVVEGEIVKWLVQSGDSIDIDQPMVEVMTDKATVVIPSPVKGTVKETRGGEGDLVEVHSVICIIDQEGGADAPTESAPAASGASAKTEALVRAEAPVAKGGKVLAAPATRRLARELGVDLTAVQGT